VQAAGSADSRFSTGYDQDASRYAMRPSARERPRRDTLK
jgi:hypothetical protein